MRIGQTFHLPKCYERDKKQHCSQSKQFFSRIFFLKQPRELRIIILTREKKVFRRPITRCQIWKPERSIGRKVKPYPTLPRERIKTNRNKNQVLGPTINSSQHILHPIIFEILTFYTCPKLLIFVCKTFQCNFLFSINLYLSLRHVYCVLHFFRLS